MKNSLRSAFDQIKADDALFENTMDYLHGEMAKRENRRCHFVKRFAVLVTCIATVFIVCGTLFHQLYLPPKTYVSIDVNPSIELTLNEFDSVIAAHAYNIDGNILLNRVDIQGEKYDLALTALITEMEHGGFIMTDGLISITVQTANAEKENEICQSLRHIVEYVLTESPEIEVFPVTRETWSNAHGYHMTPARYLAIQELLEVDETATLDLYSDSTIRQIRQRAQQCREGHGASGHSGSGNSSRSGNVSKNHGGRHGRGHHGGSG